MTPRSTPSQVQCPYSLYFRWRRVKIIHPPLAVMMLLLQQGEHVLRRGIRLRQHGGTSLLQDLRLGQVRGFSREIRVEDSAAGGREVLGGDLQAGNRRLEAGLHSTQRSAAGVDRGQRRVDGRQCRVRAADRRDVDCRDRGASRRNRLRTRIERAGKGDVTRDAGRCLVGDVQTAASRSRSGKTEVRNRAGSEAARQIGNSDVAESDLEAIGT